MERAKPGVPLFPLQPDICTAYVLALGECSYSIGTIRSVLIASLKRLNRTDQNLQHTPPDVNLAFSSALRRVSELYPQLRKVQSRAPCRMVDLVKIIDAIPKGAEDLARRAACWLTSCQTGARSVTMVNVTLGDIICIKQSEDRKTNDGKPLYIVKLRYNVSKNIGSNWNHEVNIEGQTEVRDTGDAVYWLERLLEEKFRVRSLSLHNHSQWHLSKEEAAQSLFGWNTTDAMAEAFAIAAEKAGFPPRYLTFHSLRAGFICSALMEAALCGTEHEKTAIIERTALIAGWKAGGRSQNLYIKMQAIGSLIGTRVTGGGPANAPRATSDTDPALLRTEVYHNLKTPLDMLESKYKPADSLFQLYEEMNRILKLDRTDPDYERKHISAVGIVFYRFYRRSGSILQESVGKLGSGSYRSQAISRTRLYIAELLHADFDQNLPLILEELRPDMEDLVSTHKYSLRPKKCPVEERGEHDRAKNPMGSRKRIAWSPVEEEKLLQGIKLYGTSWRKIAEMINEGRPNDVCRTGKDCYDKNRTMQEQEEKKKKQKK